MTFLGWLERGYVSLISNQVIPVFGNLLKGRYFDGTMCIEDYFTNREATVCDEAPPDRNILGHQESREAKSMKSAWLPTTLVLFAIMSGCSAPTQDSSMDQIVDSKVLGELQLTGGDLTEAWVWQGPVAPIGEEGSIGIEIRGKASKLFSAVLLDSGRIDLAALDTTNQGESLRILDEKILLTSATNDVNIGLTLNINSTHNATIMFVSDSTNEVHIVAQNLMLPSDELQLRPFGEVAFHGLTQSGTGVGHSSGLAVTSQTNQNQAPNKFVFNGFHVGSGPWNLEVETPSDSFECSGVAPFGSAGYWWGGSQEGVEFRYETAATHGGFFAYELMLPEEYPIPTILHHVCG